MEIFYILNTDLSNFFVTLFFFFFHFWESIKCDALSSHLNIRTLCVSNPYSETTTTNTVTCLGMGRRQESWKL